MKWLITGGCGFIGLNLIKNLLDEGGHLIRVIDNNSTGTRDDLASVCDYTENSTVESAFYSKAPCLVEFICGDIIDEKLALKAVEGADVIVHLAANTGVAPSVENPRFDCIMNVIGTLNYLEAARIKQVNRFIFASSGAPAGECIPPIHEELPPHPVSPYGASKLSGEGYCSAYFRTFGVETVALRFSNAYGPLSTKKESIIAKFIKLALREQLLEVYGDGSQTRDFLYVNDLIHAIRQSAIVENIGGETFQIATSVETSISELVDLLRDALKIKPFHMKYTDRRLGDVKRNFSDISKAKDILHWDYSIPLETGLKQTVEWFNQNARFSLNHDA